MEVSEGRNSSRMSDGRMSRGSSKSTTGAYTTLTRASAIPWFSFMGIRHGVSCTGGSLSLLTAERLPVQDGTRVPLGLGWQHCLGRHIAGKSRRILDGRLHNGSTNLSCYRSYQRYWSRDLTTDRGGWRPRGGRGARSAVGVSRVACIGRSQR
jgi:hypothetical protein